MAVAHILVGCGGSGLQTLRSLAELIAEDPYWRKRAAQQAYFFAVDSNHADLKRFEREIKSMFPMDASRPYVHSFLLSQQIGSLEPLVRNVMVKPFENGSNDFGRKRLQQHWWHSPQGQPFTAANLRRPLTDGAGQCPPVSFFLAWYGARHLKHAIYTTVDTLIRRTGGLQNVEPINVLIVASLAGGTGRGTWNLIAYLLREELSRQTPGSPPMPTAVLYDYSVFPEVVRRHPSQRVPMQLNSLTGFSELSCWVKNRRDAVGGKGSFVEYRLPDMQNPQHEESDVVRARIAEYSNESAPADHLFLCFGENENHHLGESKQYFQMMGQAIFGRMVLSEFDAQAVNQNFDYLSMGSACYEVQGNRIRRYFEARVREYFVWRLNRSDQDAAQSLHDDLKKTTPFSAATFFQKMIEEIKEHERFQERFANIGTVAREEQNYEAVAQAIRNTLEPSDARMIVEESGKTVLATFQEDFIIALLKCINTAIHEQKSIGVAATFLSMVAASLKAQKRELDKLSREADDPFAFAKSRSTRRYLIKAPFEESEIDDILEAVNDAIETYYGEAIVEYLKRAYDSLADLVARRERDCENVLQALRQLKCEYEEDVCQVSEREGVTSSDEVRSDLFNSADEPERGVHAFDPRRFYRFTILPIYPRHTEDKDLAELTAGATDVLEHLSNLCAKKETTSSPERETLVRDMRTVIEANVSVPSDFVEDKFSVVNCLRSILKAWEKRIEREGDSDRRYSLLQRFQSFFGYEPQDDGRMVRTKPVNETLTFMAFNVAKLCRPYWLTRRQHGTNSNVSVFLRMDTGIHGDKAQYLSLFKELVNQFSAGAQSTHYSMTPSDEVNPFLILAIAESCTNDLNEISSLDYWKEAEIVDEIRAAESEDGPLIFDTSRGRNGGLGFIDPSYVRDRKLVEMRWRPWAEGMDTPERRSTEESVQALYYALFGNHEETSSEIRRRLSEIQWLVPLIEAAPRGRYVCSRGFLDFDNDRIEPDRTVLEGWSPNKSLHRTAGIHYVLESLQQNRAVRERLLREANSFWNGVLHHIGMPDGSPAFRETQERYHSWLRERHDKDKKEANREVWKQLIEYGESLR